MEPHKDALHESLWQAGMAKVDITPPLGVWLMGFGMRIHGASGMHDPLYASALVLSNGVEKTAIVSCDLLSLGAEDVQKIRLGIAENTDIDPAHVMVHATHTHAGPLVGTLRGFGQRDMEYESILIRQIVSAVVLANQRIEPVTLTYGTALAPIGMNRRARLNGSTQIGENPNGAIDNKTAVVGLWRKKGTDLLGFIMWAAVHPVMLGGANYYLSRDIPGKAIDRIEKQYLGSVGLYLTGPCGNINPRGMTEPDKVAMVEQHGTTLAGAGLMALANGRLVEPGRILALSTEVNVPLLPLPSAHEIQDGEEKVRQSILAMGSGADAQMAIDYRLQWAADALASVQGQAGAQPQATHITAEIQLIMWGDLSFTTLPFEAFVEYQGMAEQSAPGKDALVVAYANGNYGYMFTADAFSKGGYEVTGAYQLYALQRFAPEAPDAVAEGIRKLHSLVAQG